MLRWGNEQVRDMVSAKSKEERLMNGLKKGIGILMCCLTVMGMFSVGTLPVQAAQCQHDRFIVGYDVPQYAYETAAGHFEVRGRKYECPNCKYAYWEDLYHIKVGDHNWAPTKHILADGTSRWENYCAGCGKYVSDF